jgi:hypothetical protein
MAPGVRILTMAGDYRARDVIGTDAGEIGHAKLS